MKSILTAHSVRALAILVALAGSTPASTLSARHDETAHELAALFDLLEAPGIPELLELSGEVPTLEQLLEPREPDAAPVQFTPLALQPYESLAQRRQLDEALRLALTDAFTSIEAQGTTNVELATCLFALGNILEARGDLPAAERAFRSAIVVLRDLFGPIHPELATSWIRLGAARMVAGDFRQAGLCARMGMGIQRRTKPDGDQWLPSGLHNLGMVHGAQGDLAQAEQLLEAALVEWNKHAEHSAPRLAGTAFELGRVLRMSGELERAEEYLREALDTRLRVLPPGHPAIPQSVAGLAAVRRDRGDLREAEALFRDALARFRSALGPNHPQVAIATSDLGLLLADRGELEESEQLLREAIRSFRALRIESLLATAVNNLGHIQALLGDKAAAEELFGEAVALYGRLFGPNDSRVAVATASLSTLLLERSELEGAERFARKALEIAEVSTGPKSTLVADIATGLAGILLQRGQLDEAAEYAERAVELHARLSPTTDPTFAGARSRLGSIRLDQGKYEEAGALLREALDQLEWLRERVAGAERERALFAGRFKLGDLAVELISAELGAGRVEAALDVAERRSGRALLDLVLRVNRGTLAQAEESEDSQQLARALEAEEAARRRLLDEEAAFRRAASRDEALERIENARLDLRRAETQLLAELAEAGPDPRPSSASELSASLEAGELLLYVVWSKLGVLVLTIAPGEQPFVGSTVALTQGEIEELGLEASSLSRRLAQAPDRREDESKRSELDAEFRDLGARLFTEPIARELARARRVIVVADGPLVGLPFDRLIGERVESESPPLRVSYAPSGTMYLRLRAAGAREASAYAAGSLIVGDPSFGDRVVTKQSAAGGSPLDNVRLWGSSLQALPGTRVEAERVAAVLGASDLETKLLLGEHATLGRVEAELHEARVLHLATHGLAGSPARPYDASLALAAPEEVTTDDFGFLTLDHMLRRWRGKLANCELVVLSACDTSRGTRIGDSLMALPWGFFHAGAPTVIASLWRVDDAAAALLMQRFYENWTGSEGAPMPIGDALDEAKSWLRTASRRALRVYGSELLASGASREPGSEKLEGTAILPETLTPYADPYYWAGFVLFGDPD